MSNGTPKSSNATSIFDLSWMSSIPFSFEDGQEIIVRGEEAANKMKQELDRPCGAAEAGRSEEDPLDYPEREDLLIQEISIRGNRSYTDQYCIKKLGLEEGEIVNREDFMKGIDKLTATGNFESVFLQTDPSGGGCARRV